MTLSKCKKRFVSVWSRLGAVHSFLHNELVELVKMSGKPYVHLEHIDTHTHHIKIKDITL
jgi:hypothetical protein